MVTTKAETETKISQIRKKIRMLSALADLTTEQKADLKALFAEETALIETLPALHIAELKEPESILSDAFRLLPEAIEYIYITIKRQIESSKYSYIDSEPALIGLNNMNFNRFSEDFLRTAREGKAEAFNPDQAVFFLERKSFETYVMEKLLIHHLKALEGSTERKRLKAFIRQTVKSSAYIREAKDRNRIQSASVLDSAGMLPVYSSPVFDDLARLKASDFESGYSDGLKYTNENGFSMMISDVSQLNLNMSVRTHQLFSIALGLFTENNRRLSAKNLPESYEVIIPIDKYVELLGYDITERIMTTPEEQAKEHKRAVQVRRDARKAIRKDLNTLHHTSAQVKTKNNGHFQYHLCTVSGFDNDYVYIKFSADIIRYLATLPQTKYPLWLPKISGRSSNTYRIGNKLTAYASMNNNRKTGQSHKLKVRNLLAVTDLPTMKDLNKAKYNDVGRIRNQARNWQNRIRQPFETALDNLIELDNGGLISWHYARPGRNGEKVERQKVDRMTSFTDFADLFIVFELAYEPEMI